MNNSPTFLSEASSAKLSLTQLATCSAQSIPSHNQPKTMIKSVMMQITSPWTMIRSVLVTVSPLKADLHSQLEMKNRSIGRLLPWNLPVTCLMPSANNRWENSNTLCPKPMPWKRAKIKLMTFNEASWKTRRRKRTKRRRTKTATISCKSQISLPIAQTHQVNLFKSNSRLWTKKWLDNLRKCWWDSDSKVQ